MSLPGSTDYATVLCVPRAVAESHVPRGAVWKRTSLLALPKPRKPHNFYDAFLISGIVYRCKKKIYLEMKQL